MDNRTVLLTDQSFYITDKMAALHASAESSLIRVDEHTQSNSLFKAIRATLLRIEALSSMGVSGKRIPFSDLATAELIVSLYPMYRNAESLRRAMQLFDIKDVEGTLSSYFYLCTIDWISQNIKEGSAISYEDIQLIHDLCRFGPPVKKVRSKKEEDEGLFSDYGFYCNDYLMDDYLSFINKDLLTPTAQAAVSHSQFTKLYPFLYETERIARLLTFAIFYRRGMVKYSVPPLAVGPAELTKEHPSVMRSFITGLPEQRLDTVYGRNNGFAYSALCTKATAQTIEFCIGSLERFYKKWCTALSASRDTSTAAAFARALLEMPVFTVTTACAVTKKSFSAINKTVELFQEAGLIKEHKRFAKHRVFVAEEVVTHFDRYINKITPSQPLE